MQQVEAGTAASELAALLDRVRLGEEITITDHGHPVAVIAPARTLPAAGAQAAERIIARGDTLRLDGLSIKHLINAGRE